MLAATEEGVSEGLNIGTIVRGTYGELLRDHDIPPRPMQFYRSFLGVWGHLAGFLGFLEL